MVKERPLSDNGSSTEDEENENDPSNEYDPLQKSISSQPILPDKGFNAPSRSYLKFWSGNTNTFGTGDNLINVTFPNDGSIMNKNEIAIKKIIHDHNHNHKFFWSHFYDHNTATYNKPSDDEKKDEENMDDTYSKFLKYLRENEDENANYDVKTQVSLIKMDLLNAIQDKQKLNDSNGSNSSSSNKANPATTAFYKYVDVQTQFKYSDKNLYGENMIHRPLAITHGNNIVFLLFPDGNIWSAYHNHLLQPEPFQPNSKNIKMLDPTYKNMSVPMSVNTTMSRDATIDNDNDNDNEEEEEAMMSPSPESGLLQKMMSNDTDITPSTTPSNLNAGTKNPAFVFAKGSRSTVNNQSVLTEADESENGNDNDEEEKISEQQSPMKYTFAKEKEKKKEIKTERDYVKKTLNKPFKTRPLVIGDWRIGEGEHRWFLIKYVPNLRDINMCNEAQNQNAQNMNVDNDNDDCKKVGGNSSKCADDMNSAMNENIKLDWELSEEDSRSKLVFMISPAGRIWSCCGGGCWYNAGEYDKTFNDKYERFNDKQHKIVSNPLPFCRAGLTLVPDASYIRPNINYYDEPAMKERNLIIRQLRCLAIPNEIVPLKISEQQGDKLRGSYSNFVYGVDMKQKYFVHYNCVYLWDSWKMNNDIYC